MEKGKPMSETKRHRRNKLAILVGGGPAPGINGVISASTIEAINRGIEVIGIRDGFKWLAEGDIEHIEKLTIQKTSRIHNTGGSIIGISRLNPSSSKEKMKNTIRSLTELGVRYLITIGGDGTLFQASEVEKEGKGRISVAHVPKTIDNNIPLPGYISTFGFETARHIGTMLVHYLMEDARTTRRWYFVVTMGRKTGHLALGIGKASGATVTLIPEQFGEGRISLRRLTTILEGSIIKRLAAGREDGVAILAEGLIEKLNEGEIKNLKDLSRDELGRIRLSEVDLGEILKHETIKSLEEKGINARITDKTIGYELRSAPPIPFDAKYTRDLGYSAVKYLLSGGSGALITMQTGKMVPVFFDEVIDPVTKQAKIRYVDIDTESYEVAQKYMIKLNEEDLTEEKKLRVLSKTAGMKPGDFKKYFSDVVR
ncbi:MAG: diphosphate--fructose-6-phosphate 1-phosphotransferase [Thermodesulfobacteriota bacterium]